MKFDGELVLYGSTTSPFVRKARMALLEKSIAHRFELTPPWSPTGGVEKLNPLHKVPALGLGDGTYVYDSRVIVQYLEARQPEPSLLPATPQARIEVLRIEALADGLSDAVALYVQEGWRRSEARSAFWIDRQLAKVRASIVALEGDIAPWMPTTGPLQLAPIAVGAAIAFTSFWISDLDWRNSAPRLMELWDRLETVDSWQRTRPYLAQGAAFPKL